MTTIQRCTLNNGASTVRSSLTLIMAKNTAIRDFERSSVLFLIRITKQLAMLQHGIFKIESASRHRSNRDLNRIATGIYPSLKRTATLFFTWHTSWHDVIGASYLPTAAPQSILNALQRILLIILKQMSTSTWSIGPDWRVLRPVSITRVDQT